MLIYHYTDLNAAISIARHSKLWLTDTRFLNDKEEFSLGLEYLIETLTMFNEYPDGTSDNFKKFIANWSGKTNISNFFPELPRSQNADSTVRRAKSIGCSTF